MVELRGKPRKRVDTTDNEYNKLTVKELDERLRSMSLSIQGNKQTKVKRLSEALHRTSKSSDEVQCSIDHSLSAANQTEQKQAMADKSQRSLSQGGASREWQVGQTEEDEYSGNVLAPIF